MRIVIASHSPLQPELGAAQVHMNLASTLRGLGHEVRLWSPSFGAATHWSTWLLRVRAQWRAFLSTAGAFDVVDTPAFLVNSRAEVAGAVRVCRNVQPDIQYFLETLRAKDTTSVGAATKATGLAAYLAAASAWVCRGWSMADIVMCHTSSECRRIGRWCPWLKHKLTAFDGALADGDRDALGSVRRARRARPADAPLRYIWIGRWVEHKGTRLLEDFLGERLEDATRDEFTVAGCGARGAEALASLARSSRLRVIPSFVRSELPELLAQHDAGLFTSRVEGWGLVLNEMLEAGLPVYATDAGGVEDLRSVLGESIQSFPPRAGAVLPDPPLPPALARYDARFSWKAVADRYLESLRDYERRR
jgi:glycosyltransferase involved in cell wall biosynthesis